MPSCRSHSCSNLHTTLPPTLPSPLQADNTPGALDAILPEPFLQLHRPHLQKSMPLPPHITRRAISCFNGITVCLASISVSPIR